MRFAKPLSSRGRSILHRAAGLEQLEQRLLFANVTASGRPLGIDVSRFQGASNNWTTLAGQKDFAIIKGTGSDEGDYTDSTFSNNVTGARAAGMIFGTYHFADPDSTTTSATAQADFMIAHSGVAMENGNLPPMLDLEVGADLGSAGLSNWVNAFCNEIYARLGVKPIIYASGGNYAALMTPAVYNTWRLVDADYGNDGQYTDSDPTVNSGNPPVYDGWISSTLTPKWQMWQYSSVASVSGIQTNPVDEDVFDGTFAQLQAMEISAQAVVLNGTTSIASGGGTDSNGNTIVQNYGSVSINGTAPTMTFTIKNEGVPNVTLSNLQVPSGYSIVGSGLTSTTLASLGSETITVQMNTGTAGTFAGNITFTTNDPDTPTFKIPVTGSVVSPPQVVVKEGSVVITNGQSTPISFGSAKQGAASPGITFTVSNPGSTALTTSGLTVPTGFTINNGLASSIAAGGSDTILIAMSTGTAGTFSGNVSFNSNASPSTFTFAITGKVTDVTPPTVVSGSFDDDYQPTTVSFKFSEPVQTLTTSNLTMSNTDGNAAPTVSGYNYFSATNTATFNLTSGLVDGHYQAVLNGVKDLAGNALSGSNALNFSFNTADADGDGTVDSGDFAALAAHYGMTGNLAFSQGDFNYDGTVNALDFNALATRYGLTELPAGSSLATGSAPADSPTAASLPASATPGGSLFSNQPVTGSAMDLTDKSDSSSVLS